MKKNNILLINGPNLNLLGTREIELYGTLTLAEIESDSKFNAKKLELNLDCFQSNNESEIISRIQIANESYKGILINAGAFTHTSIAIRDALISFKGAKVEVHMSNVYKREKFRHISLLSDICDGSIVGFGKHSYLLGIRAIYNIINN